MDSWGREIVVISGCDLAFYLFFIILSKYDNVHVL